MTATNGFSDGTAAYMVTSGAILSSLISGVGLTLNSDRVDGARHKLAKATSALSDGPTAPRALANPGPAERLLATLAAENPDLTELFERELGSDKPSLTSWRDYHSSAARNAADDLAVALRTRRTLGTVLGVSATVAAAAWVTGMKQIGEF